jgi:serine/threonine-protein kinase
VLAVILAIRNYRLERSDSRGALRLAIFVMSASFLIWVFQAKHHAALGEYYRFATALGQSLFDGATFGILYLGLEPYVRRRWPQSLISWTRLLGGGLRDPVVGAHLLIGTAIGIGSSLLFFAENLLIEPAGSPVHGPTVLWLAWLEGLPGMSGAVLETASFAIGLGLLGLFLFFLARILLRSEWLGGAVLILLFSVFYGLRSTNFLVGTLWMALHSSLMLLPLLRFGVLQTICAVFVSSILGCCPMTTDFSAWYAGNMATAIAVVLVLAVYGFHTAAAGRPLVKPGFLDW